MSERCNGFKLIPGNPDCDQLACQSSEQTTWRVGYRLNGQHHTHTIGIARDEIIVLRAYGGASPAFDITPLGDKAGLLYVEHSRGGRRSVPVGTKYRVELGRDESCIVTCEQLQHPRHAGVRPGAYGDRLQV
jgi:hypothetical protein